MAFEEISADKKNIELYDINRFKSSKYNDIFRLRIGSYRAIFRIIDNELIVYIFDIGSRGDIYKRLKL
ncbi:type II toxin-antitoxin system RelE/ParE family toxin [Tuanshanicoccus lijuaniae]|uniref:type II toxin-antitoxin system RelE family toxin n=1 Tax=Aerococcaceae bacterium zg-1292 TaxID=2774330 RepID=UPI0019376656|nr:type II toxin-antitoxin system RelE/ParE family toxin [Aerococcaceae bacterium zg-A91]MBS4457375.1 type II toxin-antitoxin system RelE/ParE family toxin [Aerococcaceae bacterium zg-BR33]QQA36929.1 type II toxin-antitoxin system RelE/ParE family toxin [Aerococcaceae bacterium zg-1292]